MADMATNENQSDQFLNEIPVQQQTDFQETGGHSSDLSPNSSNELQHGNDVAAREAHQSPDSQPQQPTASEPSHPLVEEARAYGLSDQLINSMPPEQLDQVMNEFARLNSSPYGMNQGYQQPYQQQGYQQPPQQPQQYQQQPMPPQQQQQQQQPQGKPDWDNEDLFDPDMAQSMKYLDSKVDQLLGFYQQQQQQAMLQEYLGTLDGLNSDVISRNNLNSREVQMHSQLYEQFTSSGYGSEAASRLALRALGISSKEELKGQAQARNQQIAGGPIRSANGQFASALDKVKEKLREHGVNPESGHRDDYEGFLD